MRNILTGLCGVFMLASCSTVSGITAGKSNKKEQEAGTAKKIAPNTIATTDKNMGQVALAGQAMKSDTRMERIEQTLAAAEIKDVRAVNASVITVPPAPQATELQLKYAGMINVLPGYFTNNDLLEAMDEWYGTRYRFGGTTKYGIDCSAFTREMYREAYGVELPRTAREQYGTVRKVSSAELKEGDLVFFNTRGGVSHVGVYLGNNKFVHASTSRGVTISDLYDNYYLARYIGAGRIEKSSELFAGGVPSKILNN